MINIVKSMPPPKCLEKEKKKTRGDYKCGDVLKRTKNDFKNKCYICEYKQPTSINVEHFIPHKGNKELKFDWNNLFWACSHCNNTKAARGDNILNCTSPEQDVENWLTYEFKPFPKEKVKITALSNEEIVHNTVRLLIEVYNGTTPLKMIESSNLRQALLNEIVDFQQALMGYYDENAEDAEKAIYLRKIKQHLKKSSAFTAFKRWIVKENPVFKQEFQRYFD